MEASQSVQNASCWTDRSRGQASIGAQNAAAPYRTYCATSLQVSPNIRMHSIGHGLRLGRKIREGKAKMQLCGRRGPMETNRHGEHRELSTIRVSISKYVEHGRNFVLDCTQTSCYNSNQSRKPRASYSGSDSQACTDGLIPQKSCIFFAG